MKAGRRGPSRPGDVSRGTFRGTDAPDHPGLLSESQVERLREIARASGTPLPLRFRPACDRFLSELDKWNRKINLISARDRARVVERHVLDSLCLLAFKPRLAGQRIMDVGTGAGFPGMVLAMWDEKVVVTLVESRSKPVAFLRAARRSVGLSNVEIVHARLESAVASGKIPPPDIVTSRAVGNTIWLAEQVAPMLGPGGAVVVYAARRGSENAFIPPDADSLRRFGYGLEHVTPPWQSLTTLLILRKLA